MGILQYSDSNLMLPTSGNKKSRHMNKRVVALVGK